MSAIDRNSKARLKFALDRLQATLQPDQHAFIGGYAYAVIDGKLKMAEVYEGVIQETTYGTAYEVLETGSSAEWSAVSVDIEEYFKSPNLYTTPYVRSKPIGVTVSYIDTIEGGSGATNEMPLEELPMWLAARPGFLIREIIHTDLRLNKEQRVAAHWGRQESAKNMMAR